MERFLIMAASLVMLALFTAFPVLLAIVMFIVGGSLVSVPVFFFTDKSYEVKQAIDIILPLIMMVIGIFFIIGGVKIIKKARGKSRGDAGIANRRYIEDMGEQNLQRASASADEAVMDSETSKDSDALENKEEYKEVIKPDIADMDDDKASLDAFLRDYGINEETVFYYLKTNTPIEIPVTDISGTANIYSERDAAYKMKRSNYLYSPKIESDTYSNIVNKKLPIWAQNGIVKINIILKTEGASVRVPVLSNDDRLKKTIYGSAISKFAAMMGACQAGIDAEETRVSWKTYQSFLAKAIGPTPLFIAAGYDGEDPNAQITDKQLHMTGGARDRFTDVIGGKDGAESKYTIAGANKYFGGNLAALYANDTLAIVGTDDLLSSMVQNNDFSSAEKYSGKTMHIQTIVNQRTGQKAIPVFTDFNNFEVVFGKKHVGLYTFEEILNNASEADGIMINPGPTGVNYFITPEQFDDIREAINSNEIKVYDVSEENKGLYKVTVTEGSKDNEFLTDMIADMYGYSKDEAKEKAGKLPFVMAEEVVKGAANHMADELKKHGCQVEVIPV